MDGQEFTFVNDQKDARVASRKYGKFGTVGKNGCGMIALYNIERAANQRTQFESFYAARDRIKTNLFGLLGTRPSTIGKNLQKKRFHVQRIPIANVADAEAFDGVIVLYWWIFGAHYVAGIRNENGTYTFYNQFSEPYAMPLSDFIAYLKQRKLHPHRVWGIRFPEKQN